MADIIDEVVTEVEAVVEETFKPKPGGLVDTHRKNKARRDEAQREKENADERVEEPSYKAIKTTNLAPESISTVTYNVAQGARQLILPLNKYRHRATIQIQTTSGFGLICKDESSAVGGIGYILGNFQPLILETRGQVWFQNQFGGTCIICVISEFYAPESM